MGTGRTHNPWAVPHPTSCLVLGAGASGLSLSHVPSFAGCDGVLVCDAAEQAGGKIRTLREDGFVVELGPTGWLDHQPEWHTLCAALDLKPIRSGVGDGQRLMFHRGRLVPVPAPGIGLLRAGFLSPLGRLRLLLSPLSRRQLSADESVHAHGVRRFGREFTDTLLDAAAGGIFAGDSKKMSVRASFPQLLKKLPSGPAPGICSFPTGMAELPERAGERLLGRLKLGCRIDRLECSFENRITPKWQAWSVDQLVATTKQVVSTVPAPVLVAMLGDLAPPELLDCVEQTGAADLVVVAGAWPNEQIHHSCQGFGVLTPSNEEAGFLNIQFAHSIFPEHVPPGFKMLKAMLGGAANPQVCELNDQQLTELAFSKISKALGINTAPERTWVHRIPNGVPQYLVGHMNRVDAAQTAVSRQLPGLHLAGESFFGIGLNPALRHSLVLGSSVRVV